MNIAIIDYNSGERKDRLALQADWTHGCHLNTRISLELMAHFSPDHQWNKYSKAQKQVCETYNLTPSNCVHIALGDENWLQFNRDKLYNRVKFSSFYNSVLSQRIAEELELDIFEPYIEIILVNKDSAFDSGSRPKELPIIIKCDVHGSSEALKTAIEKIEHAEVAPKIILSNIGVITETDVTLAIASKAIVIGFNVRPNKEAKKLAEIHKITIKFFNIIYEVLDFVNNSLSGLLKPDVKEEVVGSAEVQTIFKVSKIGKVAGSKVINGEIINNLNARLIRDGNVLYTGSIGSIFREKNAAKQVAAGLECGITLKDFVDFKEKDVIEVYKIIETERRI